MTRQQEWRQENPERYRAIRQRQDKKRRMWLDAVKNVPCADCASYYPPECMDFDHVRGVKLFGIGRATTRRTELVEAEIAKCDVVCANCHRIRTRQRKAAQRG